MLSYNSRLGITKALQTTSAVPSGSELLMDYGYGPDLNIADWYTEELKAKLGGERVEKLLEARDGLGTKQEL